MKKPIISIILTTILLFVSACTKELAPPPPPTGMDGAVLDATTEIPEAEPTMLRVQLFNAYRAYNAPAFSDGAVAYVNANLRELGFNMEFLNEDADMVHNPGGGRDIDPYVGYVVENIKENILFILPSWFEYRVISDELKTDNLLKDFYGEAYGIAPGYLDSPGVSAYNDPGKLEVLPLGVYEPFFNELSVLVRGDIDAEYGKPVRTATDYEELLAWIKNRSDETPGIALFNSYTIPYALYMPEMGYWLPFDQSTFFMCGREDYHLYPTYMLTEARVSIERFMRLAQDGLLDLYGYYSGRLYGGPVPDFLNYPTILMNPYVFKDLNGYEANAVHIADVDFSDYHMYVLYDGMLPKAAASDAMSSGYASYHAVAGENAGISEFLLFLEWLGNKENYTYLFYGEEGADYYLSDNKMIIPENDTDWQAIRDLLSAYFKREEFEPAPRTAPGNYAEAVDMFTPLKIIMFDDADYKPIAEWSEDEDNLKAMNVIWNEYGNMMHSLFDYPLPDSDHINKTIDDFFKGQELSNADLAPYSQLYQQALDNAR